MTYSSNIEKATSTLNELYDRKEQFKEFVDAIQTKPECCGLLFGAYLIMPIQRSYYCLDSNQLWTSSFSDLVICLQVAFVAREASPLGV